MPFRRLADRARRANLVRVLTLYLSACFVALQLVDMFAGQLEFSRRIFTGTLITALVGLPIVIAVVLARAEHAPAALPSRAEPRHWLTWQRVGLGVITLFALWGLVAAGWLLLGPTKAANDAAAVTLGTMTVTTSPTAQIRVVRDSATVDLESAQPHELPVGEYLAHIEAPGYNNVDILIQVTENAPSKYVIQLVPSAAATKDMLHVAGSDDVAAFLIDKYEVTNAQYLEFIRAGGYQQAQLRKFVDSTGNPGPRSWAGGLYPEGTGNHPVVGVSWSEAAAYAGWRGKQLPTWEQWWRAALHTGYTLPWGSDTETLSQRANFQLEGSTPIGTHPLGASHVGAHDMAGNVREWLRSARKDASKRIAVGGSWQDPTYLFDPEWIEEFPPDFANSFIGFRCVRELNRR